MKVYVDELPKECFECPCFEGIETPAFCPCRLDFIENDKVQNYHKFDECNDNVCPLQSLADYTKQVRKEVCNDFKSRFLVTCQIEKVCDTASFSLEVLNKILDQLQEDKQ